jgi:exopolyphosphatase / guanosine-5'-triphosphate,3'-diphosphate pyrophosphatase
MRWEWRTFGAEFADAEFGSAGEVLSSIAAKAGVETDETYLVSVDGVDAVKLRAGLLDVKHLEQVDNDGLQLWNPVMKSPLPISAADSQVVLTALRVSAPLDRDTYDLAELAAAAGSAVSVIPVHKTRRHGTYGDCMAELTDLRTTTQSTRTLVLESENPTQVLAAVHALRLPPQPNTSIIQALKSLT